MAKAADYETAKFTGITTFHGLIRIYNARSRWVKLFWLVVLGLAMTGLGAQVYALLSTLAAQPVVSLVNFQTPRNGFRFPDLTICNNNPVRFSAANASYNSSGEMSEDVLAYILLSYLQVETIFGDFNKSQLEQMHADYLLFTTHHPGFTLDQFFNTTGYRCEDLFMACSFGGKAIDCCRFATPVLTDIGLCHRFHAFSDRDDENRQYIAGSFYGAQFIIYVHKEEYPSVFVTNFFEWGLRFFIHSAETLPLLSSGGTTVSPGNRIYAGIIPTHYELLPESEWGMCKPSWEEEEERLPDGQAYTSSSCEAICVADTFQRLCNCTPLRYHLAHVNTPLCEPLKLYQCFEDDQGKIQMEGQMAWAQECHKCKIECDRWEYRLETSYAGFPSFSAKNFLHKKLNLSESVLT